MAGVISQPPEEPSVSGEATIMMSVCSDTALQNGAMISTAASINWIMSSNLSLYRWE